MSVPAGVKLNEGFSTTVSFELNATVGFWEIEIQPPGFDGGGPNDTTTMRNLIWRTKQPKKLKSMTAMQCTGAYDTAIIDQINSIVNVVQKITITFSDGSTWVFYGWLDKFTPDRVVEGAQPRASFTIECGNQTAAGVEVNPTRTSPTTTTSTTTTTTTTTP